MKNKLRHHALLLLLSIAILACKERKPVHNCKGVTFDRVYTDFMSKNGVVSYTHYLVLAKYSDECFASVNFSTLARRYVDTCSIRTPVRIIRFLESEEGIDFESREPDFKEIGKKEIVSFMMDSTVIHKMYFTRNGIRKTIEFGNGNWKETFWE
jgi:hypothetical protein